MKQKKTIIQKILPGRPQRTLDDKDWKFINQYLNAQCEGSAIASMYGMHPDTFYKLVVEKYGDEYNISTFSAYQQIKRSEGKEMLRSKQFEKAILQGDNTMLIWLGKQVLGQRDQIEQTITVPQVQIHTLDENERLEIATALTALEEHESNESLPEESDGNTEQ